MDIVYRLFYEEESILEKKLWRYLSVTLAVLLMMGVLSACATSPQTTGSSNKNKSKGSNQAADKAGSKTIHIMGPETGNPHIHFKDREKYSSWKEFQKLFKEKGLNPKFEVVANDQYQTTLQTRMASATDMPDFLNVTGLGDDTILNFVDKGTILPVNQIIDEHSDGTAKQFFAEGGKGARSNALNAAENGNVYWISQIQATTYDGKPGSTNQVISVRKDWLDKLNLEVPKTADDFYHMLKAFREKDANGNGQQDEVLAFNPAAWNNGIAQWFGLVNEISCFVIEDGKAVSPWYQPGIKDYFKYLNKLAKEGLMDTSTIGGGDPLDQVIAENKAGAIFDYCMQTWQEPGTGDPDAAYLPIGPLKATDAAEPILAIEPPYLSYNRWAFTKECKDLDVAGTLLDILCSDKYMELTQWGIEGETYEVKDGEKKLLPIALNASWEQSAKEGKAIGDSLWANGSMFPKRRFVPMENEISIVPEYKAEFQRNIIDYHPTTPLGKENYFPVPTQEQVQRRLELNTDLGTQSSQLATQLILGQISMDDWDSHIQSLKDLGLDEILKIDQTLLDRYKKNVKD